MSLTKTTFSMIEGAVFNVLDYGAVADWNGSSGTDSSTGINLAYAAAKAAGGGTVLIPSGDYYCALTIGNSYYLNVDTDVGDNIEFLGEQGTILTFSATLQNALVVLCGNNVAVRNLTINSNRTIVHTDPLGPQRTIYQFGIYIGSKETLTNVNQIKSGAQVTNCIVNNTNVPIKVNYTGNALVQNCVVNNFTDTGILIDNCTTDIQVIDNTVTNGGDDCFFARVSDTAVHAAAGAFCGRIKVSGNTFHDTLGKCAGFGGFGEIIFTNNICSLDWAGGIDLENTWGGNLIPSNYENVLIANNQFVNNGQNFQLSYGNTSKQVAAPGAQGSAFQTVYDNSATRAYLYHGVTFQSNKIQNPYYAAVALFNIYGTLVQNNQFTAGSFDHGSGPVTTTGVGVEITQCNDIDVTGNDFINYLTVPFRYCYSVVTGTGLLKIRIWNNCDTANLGIIIFADANSIAQTRFNSYDKSLGSTTFNLTSYAFVNLPTTSTYAYEGSMAYCTNGRKVGEGAGAGTGVPVYFSNSAWRVFSTDAAVAT